MFIDTHAHIYSEEFDADIENVLITAQKAGISQIYMPNIDSSSVERMLDIATKHSFCHPMMGLHPCYVKENYKTELSVVEEYLSRDIPWRGIGEIGIDLYWDKTFAKEQEYAFVHQIELAKSRGLPFVIHSRDALDITIDIVTQMQDGTLKGIFHCFNGDLSQAQRIIDTGFFMGIGGVITYKNAGVDKVVEQIDLRHLVLETDAPYLSPVPYRGKRNESSYIISIAGKLADLKQCSVLEISEITTRNAKTIFGA